jgi:hypothetical protein
MTTSIALTESESSVPGTSATSEATTTHVSIFYPDLPDITSLYSTIPAPAETTPSSTPKHSQTNNPFYPDHSVVITSITTSSLPMPTTAPYIDGLPVPAESTIAISIEAGKKHYEAHPTQLASSPKDIVKPAILGDIEDGYQSIDSKSKQDYDVLSGASSVTKGLFVSLALVLALVL